MKEASEVVVLITTGAEEEAHSIAELLLNQRKAVLRKYRARVEFALLVAG